MQTILHLSGRKTRNFKIHLIVQGHHILLLSTVKVNKIMFSESTWRAHRAATLVPYCSF